MNPEFFIVPLIMGYVSSIITSLKSGYVIIDCCLFALLYFLYYNVNARNLNRHFCTLIHRTNNKQTVVLVSTECKRSIKFRAVMYHLSKLNQSIYKIKEYSDFDWNDDGNRIETVSEYIVDQSKEFTLAENIYGTITITRKKNNAVPLVQNLLTTIH